MTESAGLDPCFPTTPVPRNPCDGSVCHPFWTEIFEHVAPVEIEIGPGDGTFLLTAASLRPHANFFGIERSRARARRLEARVSRSGLPSVRVLHANAECVIGALIPAESVAAYHVYFPDPWPKRRHAGRRLFTAHLIAGLAHTLAPGGRLSLATDVHGYLQLIHNRIMATSHFTCHAGDPSHPGLDTAFARKYLARGRQVFTGTYTRRAPGPMVGAPSEPTAPPGRSGRHSSAG